MIKLFVFIPVQYRAVNEAGPPTVLQVLLSLSYKSHFSFVELSIQKWHVGIVVISHACKQSLADFCFGQLLIYVVFVSSNLHSVGINLSQDMVGVEMHFSISVSFNLEIRIGKYFTRLTSIFELLRLNP